MALACLVAGLTACKRKQTLVPAFPETFSGIGIELHIVEPWPVVVRTLPGGPSATAGLLPGDKVLEIDGVSTEGQNLGTVVMRLRGAPGSRVQLTLERGSDRRVVSVERGRLKRQANDDYKPN